MYRWNLVHGIFWGQFVWLWTHKINGTHILQLNCLRLFSLVLTLLFHHVHCMFIMVSFQSVSASPAHVCKQTLFDFCERPCKVHPAVTTQNQSTSKPALSFIKCKILFTSKNTFVFGETFYVIQNVGRGSWMQFSNRLRDSLIIEQPGDTKIATSKKAIRLR